MRAVRLIPLAILLFTSLLNARVISYAPLSSSVSKPAIQDRMNRHFAIIEIEPGYSLFAPPYYQPQKASLVVYDSTGEDQPRVVFPPAGTTSGTIVTSAVWEAGDSLRLLVVSDVDINGDNPSRQQRMFYSANGGAGWKAVANTALGYEPFAIDRGGPIARGRGAFIRIGSEEFPFVTFAYSYSAPAELIAIGRDGSPKHLGWFAGNPGTYPPSLGASLAGSNRQGTEFLVAGRPVESTGALEDAVRRVDLSGNMRLITPLNAGNPGLEGWITPAGGVYLQSEGFNGPKALLYYASTGTGQEVATPNVNVGSDSIFFAVPTYDFAGAWIVQGGPKVSTVLSRHYPEATSGGSPSGKPVTMWVDSSGPKIEAIHAARSGQRLLIQVDRDRPQIDQRLFRDPALAVWEIGAPAPAAYDELYLNEQDSKGFVHLDVDAVAAGGEFYFDSGSFVQTFVPVPISPAPPGGGSDVVQEWGVVRASLQQTLIVPSIARTNGAYGSVWRSDLILRNSSAEPVSLTLRFVRSGASRAESIERDVEIGPTQSRLIRDPLLTLFDIEDGSGALYIIPMLGHGIAATSRTYSQASGGTYGMGMPAIDIYAAAGPRFAQTFSGALQGSDYRTNVVVNDAGGKGAAVGFSFSSGVASSANAGPLQVEVSGGGQKQLNGLSQWLGLPETSEGGVIFQPSKGFAIASMLAIDNRTNDPSYFSADLASSVTRIIPALAHIDGANGSHFRSDLYLYNAASSARTVSLSVKTWDRPDPEQVIRITLAAGESRVVRDALYTMFGRSGIGRLRFASDTQDILGLRVTSRIYTVAPDGGTYGLVLPPLNSFQYAGPGDSLEIMGVQGGPGFRTNLALIDSAPSFVTTVAPRVRVELFDGADRLLLGFEVDVPSAGGVQLGDIFRNQGLGDGPEVGWIRVTGIRGLVGGFASMLDNTTNDPTYLGAVLASSPSP